MSRRPPDSCCPVRHGSAPSMRKTSTRVRVLRSRVKTREGTPNTAAGGHTMARPIWSGVISFGLVSIPVGLYTATKEHEVSFHQFQRGTGDRIRYQRINERTGKEVDFGDIVKGADIGDSRYVMIEPDELDAIAPGRSRSLDVHTFVDLGEIDPVYYQKTYYL